MWKDKEAVVQSGAGEERDVRTELTNTAYTLARHLFRSRANMMGRQCNAAFSAGRHLRIITSLLELFKFYLCYIATVSFRFSSKNFQISSAHQIL